MMSRPTRGTKEPEPRPEPTSSLEATLQRLEAKIDQMGSKQDTNFTTLNNTIDEKIEAIRIDIREEVMPKIQLNTSNIAANKSEIDELRAEVERMADVMDSNSKANDLLVKGIPLVNGQKCSDIYSKIASAIGYIPGNIPFAEAFRLGKKKPGTTYDPPILLKFMNKFDKNNFYHSYFVHKTLKLAEIGFQLEQRIIITENLTKHNQSIFVAAMKIKNEARLKSVSTSNGIVFVKQREGDNKIPIKCLSGLDRFKITV
jgi:hypothetical protein